MYQNFVLDNINVALPLLCRTLLRRGEENGSRNGTVKELTHVGITLACPMQREILIPDRKANLAAQIAETMWVLTGRNDMDFLSKYLPRATDYSDDGKTWRGAYGPRLRAWRNEVDQWQHCLDLLRRDPLTRRAVMTIYDPDVDGEDGLDIPCNNWITFSSRLGKLDMHVGIRSNDLLWGWSGINAFEWSTMLEISAGLLGIQVGSLHFSTTSLHLYAPHWAKADKIASGDGFIPLMTAETPRFNATGVDDLQSWDYLADEWFTVEAAIRDHHLAANAMVESFPEPMLQSWLQVLQWWWSGDHAYLKPLAGTALEYATHVAMQPPARKPSDGSCPKCGTVMTTSGGRTPLKCIAAACNYTPSQEVSDGALAAFGGSPMPGHLDMAQRDADIKRFASLTGGPGKMDGTSDLDLPQPSDFLHHVFATHEEKHAAYGDSWKRRGEMLGITANIARKVDRLGGSETSDETSADTAMDLMVYLAKYRAWLFDLRNRTDHASGTQWVNNRIASTAEAVQRAGLVMRDRAMLEERLRNLFDELEKQVVAGADARFGTVDMMLTQAYVLAKHLWDASQDQYRGADVD